MYLRGPEILANVTTIEIRALAQLIFSTMVPPAEEAKKIVRMPMDGIRESVAPIVTHDAAQAVSRAEIDEKAHTTMLTR